MNKLLENYILKKYSTISFDIFDTLIERKVAKPSMVFLVVGENILGKNNAEAFRQNRVKAEFEARNKLDSIEITLDDIYLELKRIYGEQTEVLMNEEVEVEINGCYPKEKILEFYKKCINNGKKIVLISDMYLPTAVIKEIINRCTINKYSGLYVSSELGVNKISGKLFSKVIIEEKIIKSKIIHIGDSIRADFIGARKAGIKSILIRKKNRFQKFL